MEELFSEGIFSWVYRLFKWIIIDAIVEGVFFYSGYVTLLLLTLGRYPREEVIKKHEGRITLFGAFILVIVSLTIGILG